MVHLELPLQTADVGVFFGRSPKNTPTEPPHHGNSQTARFILNRAESGWNCTGVSQVVVYNCGDVSGYFPRS